jgi:Flp pilus assembly protein TadD
MRATLLLLTIVLSACTGLARDTDSAPPGGVNVPAASLAGMKSASLALLERSQAQQAAGEYGQAAASLERAIRIDSTHPALWIELGRVRLRQGDAKQAEQMGRKAQSLAAGDPAAESAAQKLVVDALRGQGRHFEAEELADDDY